MQFLFCPFRKGFAFAFGVGSDMKDLGDTRVLGRVDSITAQGAVSDRVPLLIRISQALKVSTTRNITVVQGNCSRKLDDHHPF